MRTTTRFAAALSVPLALLAAGPSAIAAAPQHSPAEPFRSDDGAAVPADFVTLTDDTGTITVGIPSSWTDVETAPRDGVPSVLAAPDLQAYVSPEDAPGATVQVATYTSDTDPSIFGLVATCADQEVVGYDDGVLAGSQLLGTGCGHDGLGEFHAVVANPANQAFTAYLLVTIASPDEAPIVDGILTSLHVTGAGTDAGSAPASIVAGGKVTTDQFVTLTDDSGTIAVDVPSSWTDVDTAALAGEFPQIEATPYRQAYYDTFDVPGVTYRAIHFTTDTESLVHNFALPNGCAHEAVQPYDDGAFVGSHLIDSECGSFGAAEYHVIVANPANQAFTAVVVVQITGPHERPILQRVLDSFNVAAGAGPTTSAPSTSSTVAAPTTTTDAVGAFPPPTGQVPAQWTDLDDDTGTIRISVPNTWTATRMVSPSDATVPWISATTDDALFLPPEGTPDTFGVPGVLYQAHPFDPDTAARLAASSFHDVCTAGPLQTYDDGVFVGHIQRFTACNGTATSIVRVSANPADHAFTADLVIQLTGQPDDAATLNGLLLSFNRITPGSAPTTTVVDGAPSSTVPAGPSTTAAAAAGGSLAVLQQAIQDQAGVAVTPEQSACLESSAAQLTPADIDAAAADLSAMPATVLVVLLNCGISVLGLPSG